MPWLGSLVVMSTNRSPLGSQANAVTASVESQRGVLIRAGRTLDLDDLHGTVLVTQTEELEVAVLRLLRLGVAVHLDAEVVPVRLPVDLGLRRRQHERAKGEDVRRAR